MTEIKISVFQNIGQLMWTGPSVFQVKSVYKSKTCVFMFRAELFKAGLR